MEDCMCSQITSSLLFPGIKFWLYMHPKVWTYNIYDLWIVIWLWFSFFVFCIVFIKYLLFSLHMQDFLRQNNTGKVLWQVFGVDCATLCLYGIPEHEQIMWNSFKLAGLSIHNNCQSLLWFLFILVVRFDLGILNWHSFYYFYCLCFLKSLL